MKIRVEFDVDDNDDEMVDAADATGLTDNAHGALLDRLIDWGAENIDVQQRRA